MHRRGLTPPRARPWQVHADVLTDYVNAHFKNTCAAHNVRRQVAHADTTGSPRHPALCCVTLQYVALPCLARCQLRGALRKLVARQQALRLADGTFAALKHASASASTSASNGGGGGALNPLLEVGHGALYPLVAAD